jgi:hypothetical protein
MELANSINFLELFLFFVKTIKMKTIVMSQIDLESINQSITLGCPLGSSLHPVATADQGLIWSDL